MDPDDVTLAAYLADAGRILGSSLDSAATLRQIADLIVPGVADWCAVDLLDPDGRLIPLALAHRDPDRVRLVEELRTKYPADPEAEVGSYAVARSGQAMLIPVIDEERLIATARDLEQIDLVRRLELRSWMCAPMTVAGKVLGTIGFAAAESGRTFEARHVAFAVDLAARAGAAIENARAFQTADRFRQILDAVAEAVFVLEPSTEVIQGTNQGATVLLGRSAHELAGKRLSDLVEESRETLSRIIRAVREGRSEARTIPLHFLRDGASSVPAEVLLQRVDLPGEAPTTVAIARDVRERQEVQGRLRRLAEAEHARAAELNAVIRAMGDGVIVCGADGRTILANPAGRQMFPGVAETSYASILAGLHDPEDGAPRLGTHAGPIVLRTRSEPERWIEVATYPVTERTTTEGEPGGETILVLRDVTEQRQREAVRETFIGVLSHELRTPVTTIYGGARVLARDDNRLDAATRQEILTDVAEEAERLKRLIEDVVAMSRFGESDADLGREPVLLQRIVPAVMASEEERWPGVTFDVHMTPGLPTVIADPTYLEQVIRNLLANAAKYGGQGTAVEVVLEYERELDEVAVCVRDDGPGIEAHEADRLFDLFYRSPNTAASTTGAGIGLFVCARLVRAMGGRVWARPLAAGGAEFAFALHVMRED
jgi:PAS domain S-box-containing protein